MKVLVSQSDDWAKQTAAPAAPVVSDWAAEAPAAPAAEPRGRFKQLELKAIKNLLFLPNILCILLPKLRFKGKKN
jgi:hypothetical protein